MAEYLVNLSNGKTDEKGILRFLGLLYNQSGVIEATALAVSAQATPDMTVKISGSAASDDVVFKTASGDFYGGWNTGTYNVIIPSNASGVTKYDAIVAYADTAAGSAAVNNPGGLKLIAVRGSSGTPTDAEVNAAISSKPFVRLAHVTVGNGVSSINSGNVVDARSFASLSGPSAPWTSYTPAWTAAGTNPALGNGAITGRYAKISRTVHFTLKIAMGSSTTYGVGTYFFSLPFAANVSAVSLSSGIATQTGVLNYPGTPQIDSTGLLMTVINDANGSQWAPSIPFTFANTHTISLAGTYESLT